MKIVLIGPKATGKTTLGKAIARDLGVPFYETDARIEEIYLREKGEKLGFREIYQRLGEAGFREYEHAAVRELAETEWCVVSAGGGTMLDPGNRLALMPGSVSILLKGEPEALWRRIIKDGVPAFYAGGDGYEKLIERNRRIYESVETLADIIFTIGDDTDDDATAILREIESSMAARMHSPSTFGEILRTTTFGESHGRAIGAVIDGLKPGIEISEADIQKELDRRRPGQSGVTTPRSEKDQAQILSGVFEGKTTGTPLCVLIRNEDQDSSKYESLRDTFRPGHADFTFWKKYGLRDHRGGGRSSGRETAARVASGAIAKKILKQRNVDIIAFAEEIAGIRGTVEDYSFIEKNPVRAADPTMASAMEDAIKKARAEHDSVGGIVKLMIKGAPAGWGDPVFFKLDARLGMALFSIGAVKGVEIGSGFQSARERGSANNDQMENGAILSNNAGGILGGISTGQDILCRVAVKPTPSIFRPQKTLDINGGNRSIEIEGRHDPCIVPRIVPVVEAMAALVLLDAWEIQQRIHPEKR